MDRAVLTNLERREMEAERRDLPAEVGHLAPRNPREAVGDERPLDLGELVVELAGVLVAPAERGGLAGQVRARPAEALGDEPESLAVRLLGKAPPELSVEIRQQLGIAREARRETAGNGFRCNSGGNRLRQAHRDRLVAAQDVVGVDAKGPLGDLRGHGGIAVAITADPRLPRQEWSDERWPGPRPARVRRVAMAASGRAATLGRIERGVGAAVDTGQDREEQFVEEGEGRSDLVERRDGGRAQVGRPPQQGDLLAEAAPDVAVVRGTDVRLGEAPEEAVDAAQGDEHGPPPSLGGVSRQDRRDPQAADRGDDVLLGGA